MKCLIFHLETALFSSLFTILESQNPLKNDEFYAVQGRRATDFKAPNL